MMRRLFWIVALSVVPTLTRGADADPLFSVRTPAQLEAVLAAIPEGAVRRALSEHSAAVLAAAVEHEHASIVRRTVEGAQGKVEPLNTTPESIRQAAGRELPVFDTLKLVDLAVANTGPHDKRKVDPYDAAFFTHLGHVTSLESLHIISTKLGDDGVAPLANLKRLKSLRFTNNGKLTDAGLAHLAGLNQLEIFSFVGTGMKGHPFAQFNGWDRLTRSSYRGSSIDDEGLRHLCEKFPNLESISLAHAKFTDDGAVHLSRLTRLKGLEIGSRNATPACLAYLSPLPLEYLQLGDGLDSPAGIAQLRGQATLRRVTLTHCEKLDDDGLALAASLRQLEQLEIGGLDLPDERLSRLQAFAHLKTLILVKRPQGYPAETQERVRALLPAVEVKFVQ